MIMSGAVTMHAQPVLKVKSGTAIPNLNAVELVDSGAQRRVNLAHLTAPIIARFVQLTSTGTATPNRNVRPQEQYGVRMIMVTVGVRPTLVQHTLAAPMNIGTATL